MIYIVVIVADVIMLLRECAESAELMNSKSW